MRQEAKDKIKRNMEEALVAASNAISVLFVILCGLIVMLALIKGIKFLWYF